MIKNLFYVLFSLASMSVHCFGQAAAEVAPQVEVKKAQSPLEGSWLLTEAWEGLEKEDEQGIKLEFKGEKIIAHYDGELELSTYTIDTKKQQIVITTDGELVHGIYKIEKGILSLSFYLEKEEFPKGFDLEEDKIQLRFKLMKPMDKKFQGSWICIEGWESGEQSDADEVEDLTFRIRDHLFEVFNDVEQIDEDGEEAESDESFIITIDDKLKRMQLDDQMGDKYNCIYKFENDVLTIHFYDNSDAEGNNADYPKDYKITEDSVLLKLKKSTVKEAKK